MKMNMSRTAAVGLILAAGLWIGSGYLLPHETADSQAAVRAHEQEVTAYALSRVRFALPSASV